jgi:hypothetical protein
MPLGPAPIWKITATLNAERQVAASIRGSTPLEPLEYPVDDVTGCERETVGENDTTSHRNKVGLIRPGYNNAQRRSDWFVEI